MSRPTSYGKTIAHLHGLGLLTHVEAHKDHYDESITHVVYAVSPDAVLKSVASIESNEHRYRSQRTVGVTFVFDGSGKFLAANYGQVQQDYDYDYENPEDIFVGYYLCGMTTGTWRPDEKTLKAALEMVTVISPTGIAKAEAAEAERKAAAEKKAAEQKAQLATITAVSITNPQMKNYLSEIAHEISYTQRRLVNELTDIINGATICIEQVKKGEASTYRLPSANDVRAAAELMSKLETLRSVLASPLGEALRTVAADTGHKIWGE